MQQLLQCSKDIDVDIMQFMIIKYDFSVAGAAALW